MANRQPEKIDKALGAHIYKVRVEQGISRETLAKALGLTFQQVQKYECGINRICFSRLVQISKALNMKMPDLIGPVLPEWHRT